MIINRKPRTGMVNGANLWELRLQDFFFQVEKTNKCSKYIGKDSPEKLRLMMQWRNGLAKDRGCRKARDKEIYHNCGFLER